MFGVMKTRTVTAVIAVCPHILTKSVFMFSSEAGTSVTFLHEHIPSQSEKVLADRRKYKVSDYTGDKGANPLPTNSQSCFFLFSSLHAFKLLGHSQLFSSKLIS